MTEQLVRAVYQMNDHAGIMSSADTTEGSMKVRIAVARPGAGGAIGAELAARAAPDGYTLLAHTSGGMAIAPHTIPNVRFDPVKDFASITHATSAPFVLVVHPKLPATSVPE